MDLSSILAISRWSYILGIVGIVILVIALVVKKSKS
jgi:hypothetical protein